MNAANKIKSAYKYWQLLGLAIAGALTLVLGSTAATLSYDDDPKSIFEFSGTDFQDYLQLIEKFPGMENDFVVIIQGSVLEAKQFQRIANLRDAIEVIDGTQSQLSLVDLPVVQNLLIDPFSGQQVEKISEALLEEVGGQLRSIPDTANNFVSNEWDAQLVLIRVHAETVASSTELQRFSDNLLEAIQSEFGSQEGRFFIGGAPAMKVGTQRQLSQDTPKINALGALFATLVGIALFRSAKILLVITVGPACGAVWTLGIMKLAGEQISVFTSILLPLLFVVGYANAAHIIFAVLRRRTSHDHWHDSWTALMTVVKACFVSAVTTSVGFASLGISGSPLVADFGIYSAIGTLMVFLAVVLITPALCSFFNLSGHSDAQRILSLASTFLISLSYLVAAQRSKIILIGLLTCVALLLLALQNKPDYRFRENFAPTDGFHQAIEAGDTKFSGTLSANVLISWPPSEQIMLKQLIELEQIIADRARSIFETKRVTNLAALLKSTPYTRLNNFDDLERLLPGQVLDRFLNLTAATAVTTIPVRDEGARQLLPKFELFRAELEELSLEYPHLKLRLTGMSPLAMSASETNITEMALSLVTALSIIYVMISLLLRSVRLGMVCMLPNVIPIVGIASILVLFGASLNYTSVLVFTICLGIAVDDTVHFVMRFKEEFVREGDSNFAINQSVQKIGLVLIFTSSILGAGFLSLVFSSITVLKLMGLLSMGALTLALCADLVLLPALLSSKFCTRVLKA